MFNIENSLPTWKIGDHQTNSVRVFSPFTFADDGQTISFVVFFPKPNCFYISDLGAHASLAYDLGSDFSKKNLDELYEQSCNEYAYFNDSEIVAEGDINMLEQALNESLLLAISLSTNYTRWFPKVNAQKFQSTVYNTLCKTFGREKVKKQCLGKGASGNEIKFSFGITRNDSRLSFVEISAATNKKEANWKEVYQIYGKFADNKELDNRQPRLSLIEKDVMNEDYQKASTLLTGVCNVTRFDPSNAEEILIAVNQ
ncbi:hypothetical protein [Basilea psittacipulmonis]|uniref:DUF1828 domain-containing protein n=1 Tax=Basilea psittacipulmonis DSM 24701 TaxID=1072685 RepID=A0A077DG17_9BURK|nr:hypothetical protein [Basilea psittacipulmonis]AIL33111.1 hypothetical protein IX83_07175 [Basilea psittacipulmonis DSM 24701]